MSDYYIWDKETDEVKEVGDVMAWAKWYEGNGEYLEHRRVDRTVLADGTVISTVFLGLDHNWGPPGHPLIFETMVFPSENSFAEVFMERYETPQEARDGHQDAVVWADRWSAGEVEPE